MLTGKAKSIRYANPVLKNLILIKYSIIRYNEKEVSIIKQKEYYVYMTINLINGKKYIGMHYGFPDDDYLGSGKLLIRAINKYGKENFIKQILEFSENEEKNAENEKKYIKIFNACESNDFYNIHEGGNGGNTTKGYTEEQKMQLKLKLSLLNSGENNGMYGKRMTQE